MSDLDRDFAAAGTGYHDSQLTIDAGLRGYMIRVYNYMTAGVALTGASGVVHLLSCGRRHWCRPSAHRVWPRDLASPLMWLFVLAPLGLVMLLSFGINRLSAGTALTVFFVYAALVGLSLASIFLVVYPCLNHAGVLHLRSDVRRDRLYGYTTQRDLTSVSLFMFMGLIGLIIASVVNIFLHSTGLDWAISVIGVIVFVGLTAYDTQRIKEMYDVNDDGTISGRKGVMGALRLYLDVINLFLMLLRIFGNGR